MRSCRWLAVALSALLVTTPAFALDDEIQVYVDDMDKPGIKIGVCGEQGGDLPRVGGIAGMDRRTRLPGQASELVGLPRGHRDLQALLRKQPGQGGAQSRPGTDDQRRCEMRLDH